ncbi:MAG: c-type cytochrome biogenesis protein CcsB [Deltaproteobacteria bacterium]|nr:c-type cytochrome biogenesis protein CcsB [Deltaproteobacteria bacterium]
MQIDELTLKTASLLTFEYRLYWIVALSYALSALIYLAHALSGSKKAASSAKGLLITAFILHVGLIAVRTYEVERAPFQTLYETLSWFAFTAVGTYLLVSRKWKDVHLPALFVTTLAAGACGYALLTRTPAAEPLSPPLQSYWFESHVILAFFSYAVFIVSSAIEISAAVASGFLKRGRQSFRGFEASAMHGFHATSYNLVLFGFPLLTFAIFSGAAWANEAWGRYWSWDPKETWSLITWTVFTMYLHSARVPGWSERVAPILNILGFVCMMMTFLGVNWLAKLLGIPSMHVYAV